MEMQGKAVVGWVQPVTHEPSGCGPCTCPLSLEAGSSLPPLLPCRVLLDSVYLLQEGGGFPPLRWAGGLGHAYSIRPLTALITLWSHWGSAVDQLCGFRQIALGYRNF